MLIIKEDLIIVNYFISFNF